LPVIISVWLVYKLSYKRFRKLLHKLFHKLICMIHAKLSATAKILLYH
jgi:hypothetical protein